MNEMQASKRMSQVENELKKLYKRLEKYPEGHIKCNKNGDYQKAYLKKDGIRTYIEAKDKEYIKSMIDKSFVEATIADLSQELKALKNYKNTLKNYKSKREELYNNEAICNIMHADKKEEQKEGVVFNPEGLKFQSVSGNMLRSKSEVIIDQILFMNKIEYTYEKEIIINNHVFHPDFAIIHPVTGQIFYWEHFGMMDNPAYAQNAFQKMQEYNNAGIIPGVNLIMTFETKDEPLNPALVEDIINFYFF